MMARGLVLLVILLLVQACSDNDEPVTSLVDFLTVSLSANYFYDNIWVFATDDAGKVLDAHRITPGSMVTFKTLSPPDFVNFTMYFYQSGSSVNHSLLTYAGIARGETIEIAGAQGAGYWPPPATGKATLNIQNCSPNVFFNFSDGIAYSQFTTQINPPFSTVLDLRQASSKILISSHKDVDQPVYGWIEDVANAGTYTVDYNTLTPFPNNISISLSENLSGLIIGRMTNSTDAGFFMANNGFSRIPGNPVVAKFGYLDGYDEYSLLVSSTTTSPTYYKGGIYSKNGTTLPDEIVFPENSLNIENPLISNFNFSYSSTYTYRSHYWKHEATDYSINWQVFTDKPTTPAIKELPEGLIKEHPELSVNNLTHFKSSFHRFLDGYTYSQFKQDVFSGTHSTHHEYFTDSFQQK